MKSKIFLIPGLLISFLLGYYFNTLNPKPVENKIVTNIEQSNYISINKRDNMKLGAFSVSLNVKDIKTSQQFYENLGFTTFGGDTEKNYLIMKNENSLIGLFQGMFENNIITFNPGWDENANNVEDFDDIREIQKKLISKGVTVENKIDEKTSGPASLLIADPDGNVVLIDQHR